MNATERGIRRARSKGEEMGQKALDRAHKADPEFTDTFMTLLRLYARAMQR